MDIKQICIDNLGKEIQYEEYKAMIIGYNKEMGFLIASLTNDYGFTEISDDDTILLNSPLNVTYVLIIPENHIEPAISDKKDIRQICINNLGREVYYGSFKAMIVGYNIVLDFLILSLVEDCGWNNVKDTDVILLHSPLNRSYVLADVKWYKEQLVL